MNYCTPELLRDLFPITEQQARVLRCFLEEPNDDRIARALKLSPKTISAHLDNIRNRLDVRCRLELMQHVLMRVLTRADGALDVGNSPTKNDENVD